MAKKAAPVLIEKPAGLSERSQKLWCAMVPGKAQSPGALVMVEQALRALDRADEAGRAIDTEGLTSLTEATGAVHVHPAVKIERENRALFARLWTSMHLDFDGALDADRGW